MGMSAKRILTPNAMENEKIEAKVWTPLSTPFSCVIDGIQTTTQCTVGNQRPKIEDSSKEIIADFRLQSSDITLKVSVNRKVIDELMEKISKGSMVEELGWEIAQKPESQLFSMEIFARDAKVKLKIRNSLQQGK
jgi:formylmethanofuran dehydrogenase subunit E